MKNDYFANAIKLLFALCFFSAQTFAQSSPTMVYSSVDAFNIYGKAEKTANPFHRIDTVKFPKIPASVKRLLTNSAGLFIHFRSNTPTLSAKWCVSKKKLGNNMTAIMAKGLDVYIKNPETGKWQFSGVGRPSKICNEYKLVSNMDNTEKEFLVYLPLWDELSKLEVGVTKGSSLEELPNPFVHKVIIYGSSIVHGASASRPGMAYPARLSRSTGTNFVNFGVSGNAKMEPAVADMIASFDADAFVLDCVPNSSPDQIKERTNYLVKTLRKHHPKVPIIVIPTIVREHGFWDKAVGTRVAQQNKQIEIEFQKLIKEGVQDLYFINPPHLLGIDHEGTTDGTHPNDLGFTRMLDALTPEIQKILERYSPFQ